MDPLWSASYLEKRANMRSRSTGFSFRRSVSFSMIASFRPGGWTKSVYSARHECSAEVTYEGFLSEHGLGECNGSNVPLCGDPKLEFGGELDPLLP